MDAVENIKNRNRTQNVHNSKKTIKMRGLEKTDRYRIELKE